MDVSFVFSTEDVLHMFHLFLDVSKCAQDAVVSMAGYGPLLRPPQQRHYLE